MMRRLERAFLLAAALSVAVPSAADDLLARLNADPEAQRAALALGRAALDAWCLRHERLAIPDDLPPILSERSGAFVSATVGDAPRCCMGSLYPTRATLAAEIVAAAIAAAGMDARFAPIEAGELAGLRLIVSVVAAPEPVADPMTLKPGREGVAVRGERRWGVSLPGETAHQRLMIEWARIRADVREGEVAHYYRVRGVRFLEEHADE